MADQLLSIVPSHVSLPDNYVRPEPQRPRLHEVIADACVPIIDLDSPDIIGQVADACSAYGFFQVVTHGVESVPEMLEVSSKFLQLSTSSNVRTKMVRNWIDYLRLHCYRLEEFVPHWPSKPPSFKHLIGEDLSPLYVNELEQLEWLLKSTLSQARQRETQLMREQMEELRKKLEAAEARSSFTVQANRNMDRGPTPSIRHFLGEDQGVKELEQLERKLGFTLSQARQKETNLMLEQMEDFRKKANQLEEINKQLEKLIDILRRPVSTILENAKNASIVLDAVGKKAS